MYRKYLIALRRILGQDTSLETRKMEENYAAMRATAFWCFQGQDVMRKANVDFISRAKPSLHQAEDVDSYQLPCLRHGRLVDCCLTNSEAIHIECCDSHQFLAAFWRRLLLGAEGGLFFVIGV